MMRSNKGIFERLKEDHEKVSLLFKELLETESQETHRRKTLFEQITLELEAHSEAEEKVFYSRFKDLDDTRAKILEAGEEHKLVKHILSELASSDPGEEEWMAKAKVLHENVQHHVEEEEGEIFKLAKRLIDAEEAESMAEAFEQEKSILVP